MIIPTLEFNLQDGWIISRQFYVSFSENKKLYIEVFLNHEIVIVTRLAPEIMRSIPGVIILFCVKLGRRGLLVV